VDSGTRFRNINYGNRYVNSECFKLQAPMRSRHSVLWALKWKRWNDMKALVKSQAKRGLWVEDLPEP